MITAEEKKACESFEAQLAGESMDDETDKSEKFRLVGKFNRQT